MQNYPDALESQVAFVNDEWRGRKDLPRIYSRASRQANTSKRDVVIHNARLRQDAGDLNLDSNGFIITQHKTTVRDFHDKNVVKGQYFTEMREVILGLTGAHQAFPFPFYQVRSKHPEHFFDAYSLYMHCDFSPNTWDEFAQSIVKNSGSGETYPTESWDFALYNLWRPVGGDVEKDPLVLIDASTVARDDILDYHPVKEGDSGKAALPLFNPDQRFYTVPRMRPDEVLVFKQLDSRPGHSLVCPHTSFIDPTAALDARERESIDIRFMCMFPKTR